MYRRFVRDWRRLGGIREFSVVAILGTMNTGGGLYADDSWLRRLGNIISFETAKV